MEGRVDQSIIDHWQLRRLVRGDGRPGRGRSLEEEDDDEYQSRMEFPPDDVIAAVTRLAERQEKTAELSAIREDNRTQHEWGTTAAGLTGGYASRSTMGGALGGGGVYGAGGGGIGGTGGGGGLMGGYGAGASISRDVIAAVTRLAERQEKTAELSAIRKDDLTQHECAAGALCVAPPGIDVSASTHRCLDCQGKIHCALWCSENWKEYSASDRCKITPDQLSAAGRASVQDSSGARQEAKDRIAAYKLLKRSDDDDDDGGDDGEDDNPYDDSQESLIASIVECETFISD
jgi:hypothetical protein